jgi:HD superfamily phosphohydrolase
MKRLAILDRITRMIRIPDGRSVELPEEFAQIVDHADFQRLRRVRQLGPIHLVYPGAVHTRFEHSLGVFSATAGYLKSLVRQAAFRDRVTENDIVALLAAALLHDLGHYPYAHSLEALHSRAFEAPRHEDLAAEIIRGDLSVRESGPSIGDLLEGELHVDRERVARLVRLGSSPELPPAERLLASIINSAIDADKLDYLQRDSIHMGVPYGRMPDNERLLSSLTVNGAGDRIALTERGRVAGEIFLFCRYLMFSEAYWHHAARSASAMIEEALADYLAREQPAPDEFWRLLLNTTDDQLLELVAESGPESSLARRLLSGLTKNTRGLYKRVLTLNRQRDDSDRRRAYDAIYSMDYRQLQVLAATMRSRLAAMAGTEIGTGELLIDTPPRDKDRTDSIEIVFDGASGRSQCTLEEVSTVVRGITTDFVKVVKKIRVFVTPGVRERLEPVMERVESELMAMILG